MSLDAYGSGVSVDIPLRSAQRILEQSASEAPAGKGGAFVQKDEAMPYYQSYSPRSGQIFGILKQLKEEFENNLSQSQKEEVKGQEEYTALKASKEEQIAAAKKMKDEKSTEMWDNKKALSDAKEDLEATR